MCGYCTERSIFLESLQREEFGERPDIRETPNAFEHFCLLDTSNADRFIKTNADEIDTAPYTIPLYRLWDTLSGIDTSVSADAILSMFDITSMLESHRTYLDDPLYESFLKTETYASKGHFIHCATEDPILLNECMNTVRDYCKWWLDGRGIELNDPSDMLASTGIFDPIELVKAADYDRFHRILPRLFLSTAILACNNEGSKLFEYIALNPPHSCPQFIGLDLWIQRKAYCYCARNLGTEFIIDNQNRSRPELIKFAVLKNTLTPIEIGSIESIFNDVNFCAENYLDTTDSFFSKLRLARW